MIMIRAAEIEFDDSWFWKDCSLPLLFGGEVEQFEHAPEVGCLKVTLYHKPRGSRGAYRVIEHGECVRVDKSKGKMMKVDVVGQGVDLSCEQHGLQVELVQVAPNGTLELSPDGLTVESVKIQNPQLAELECKIAKNFRCQIRISVIDASGSILATGSSGVISTHNNGKEKPTFLVPDESTSLSSVVFHAPDHRVRQQKRRLDDLDAALDFQEPVYSETMFKRQRFVADIDVQLPCLDASFSRPLSAC